MSSPPFLRYETGTEEPQPEGFVLDIFRSGLDDMQAALVARFLEFWCQKNCRGPWRVEETDRRITITFGLDRDFILFRISAEYYDFNDRWQRVRAGVLETR